MELACNSGRNEAVGEDVLLTSLRVATELSRELIVVTDAGASIVYANPAFVMFSGYSLADVVGRKAYTLIQVPEDIEQVQSVMEQLRQGKAWTGEVMLGRKDREVLGVEVNLVPYQQAGKTTHYLCASHSHLLSQVAQRNDLKNLESLSHLANGVAHRFNNLLASVMGQTELIGMLSGGNPAVMERVEKILSTSQQGKEMVAQLMKFCRKAEDRRRRLDLLPILKNAIKATKVTAPSTIEWEVKVPLACPHMHAVSTDLHDMISHLFANAITAMEDTGGILTVELEVQHRLLAQGILHDEEDGAPPCLRLRVQDTGVGIPEANMKYIFEPFYTTHNMATSVGMGLSVVHGIVQQHGGVVTCRSQPGAGAVFDVYLPVDETFEDATEELMGPRGHGEKVILVDSEPMVREAGANQLRELGYQVYPFAKAKAAVDAATHELAAIDLLITEFTMPDMKALDVAHQLELRERSVPLLVTYTAASKRAIGLVGDGLFAKTLMKPCTMRELAESVRAVLGDPAQQRSEI